MIRVVLSAHCGVSRREPQQGLQGFKNVTDELDQLCPFPFVVVSPQPSPWAAAFENKPEGADSPAQQGAPLPPVGGIISGTSNTAPTLLIPPGDEPKRPGYQEPHPTNTDEKAQVTTSAAEQSTFSPARSIPKNSIWKFQTARCH
jgi:hypothetical protein